MVAADELIGPSQTAGVNEEQRLEITNSPGQGNFKLAFKDVWAATNCAYHPAAGELQAYLESITTIGAGNVVVSKASNWVYILNYQNALGQQDLPQLVADYTGLNPPATVVITTNVDGHSGQEGEVTLKEAAYNAYVLLRDAYRKTVGMNYDELRKAYLDLQVYVPPELQ